MMRVRKIVSMSAIVLMSAALLSACGKINLPTLLVLDPATSNTMTIKLPASLGGASVVSNIVGNMNTTVTIDTNKLISPQGVPATVKVNSFATAGNSIDLGGNPTGTLCTSIPTGSEAGGVAYLRPFIYKDATFQLTIPTETKSVDPNVQKLIPPIPLTLNIDAKVKCDLTCLLNLMIKGTGLNMHQVLNLTIPSNIPLIGGGTVVLDTTLKSTKTPVTDPKLDECAGSSQVVCGDGKVGTGETCDTAITTGTGVCPTSCTAPDACHTSALQGTACTAKCVDTAITPCCGDGVVTSPETCDTAITSGSGVCPTSCTAPDACHTSALTGTACTAKCVLTAIPNCCGNGIVDGTEKCDTAITSGTGKCPTSCTAPDACHTSVLTGTACQATCVVTAIPNCCGDGVVNGTEKCDTAITSGAGKCPTSCTPPNACTTSVLQGSGCMAECVNTPKLPCCGDSVVTSPETCDTAITSGSGVCPTSCNDNNVCTTDALQNAGTCNATCKYTAITACSMTSDGCCPAGCNSCNDSDCTTACSMTSDGCCPKNCTTDNDVDCGPAPCDGPDLSGTWITRITTTGTISAPDPVNTLTGATIDVVQRMVISKVGDKYNAQFEICSLSTFTPSTAVVPFSSDYSAAVLKSMSGTATSPYACYHVNDTVAFPSFTINTGWGGPPVPTTNTCPSIYGLTKTWPPAVGTFPTTCSGAVDTDGDGVYGITLPTHLFGGALNLFAAAGLTMNITLNDMVLKDATTNIGTTSFPTVGYIFGSTSGATGNLNVVPDSTAVPVTAIKLAGDVPCATVLTHCTGIACVP